MKRVQLSAGGRAGHTGQIVVGDAESQTRTTLGLGAGHRLGGKLVLIVLTGTVYTCINHFEQNTEIFLSSKLRQNAVLVLVLFDHASVTHLPASFPHCPRAITPISPAIPVHRKAVRQLLGSGE